MNYNELKDSIENKIGLPMLVALLGVIIRRCVRDNAFVSEAGMLKFVRNNIAQAMEQT